MGNRDMRSVERRGVEVALAKRVSGEWYVMLNDQRHKIIIISYQNSCTHNDTPEFVMLSTGTSAKTLISQFQRICGNMNQKQSLKTWMYRSRTTQ